MPIVFVRMLDCEIVQISTTDEPQHMLDGEYRQTPTSSTEASMDTSTQSMNTKRGFAVDIELREPKC